MPFDFRNLTPDHFELFCGRLLQAEGFTLQAKSSRSKDIGVDFVATTDSGKTTVIVEWRYIRLPTATFAHIRKGIDHLLRYRELVGGDRLLMIANSSVNARSRQGLEEHGVEIWDVDEINRLLTKHSSIATEFQGLTDQYDRLHQKIDNPFSSDERGAELAGLLHDLPPGNNHWREYEDICIDILNHVFNNTLGTPTIQSTSDDQLDRRDAIYPILNGNSFWDAIRSDCRTRLVVAEFKNYTEPIAQKEVESIQQYLFVKGLRTFGILCSRKLPSQSAKLARRRAWMEFDKLIVMVSDAELTEMLQLHAIGEDPSSIIDDQLNEFFLTLTP